MAKRNASSRRTTPGTGRVTPKGTRPDRPRRSSEAAAEGTDEPAPATTSGRYTPPIPKAHKVSPPWVPILMFGLWGVGFAVILLNYLGFLPGEADNRFLLLGLAFITGGFVTATQYH